MKHLFFSILCALTPILSYTQYQVEWQKELDFKSLSITFSQEYEDGIIFNNRWAEQSTVFNQSIILNGMGEKTWSLDWNEELPNHDIYLESINHRDSFLFIAQEPFADSFILGLLVAEKGISWTTTVEGNRETGHLSDNVLSIHQSGFALLRNKNNQSYVNYFDYAGSPIWEDEVRRASPNHSRFLKMSNTVDDSFLIITRESRLLYNSNGRSDSIAIPMSMIPEGLPSYTNEIFLDSAGWMHFLAWTSQYYFYKVFNEQMKLQKSDTLPPSCPSFGDWKLFISEGLKGEIILGGVELCDSNANFASSIMSYKMGTQDWVSGVPGEVHALFLESDGIFYASSTQIGVLNYDGTEQWSESIDTVSLFSDYINTRLVVHKDPRQMYLLARSFGPESELTIIKYVAAANVLRERRDETNDTKVYPNPFSNVLKFTSEINHIDLFNQQGVLVQSREVYGGQIQLNNLSRGIYFLRLNGTETKQIIKVDSAGK